MKQTVSALLLRIFGKPALLDAFLLLKELEDTPEAAHAEDCAERTRDRPAKKQRSGKCGKTDKRKQRPDLFADIVFTFYDNGVKSAYHQKGTETDQETVSIHGTSFLFAKSQATELVR